MGKQSGKYWLSSEGLPRTTFRFEPKWLRNVVISYDQF